MLPASRNLSIYKGDTFALKIRLREKTVDGQAGDPVDLTDATAKSQVRDSVTANQVQAELTCTVQPDDEPGVILLELSTTQTAAMTGGVWDVQVTFPDGRVRTYVRGQVDVQAEVTRG